MTKAHHYQGNCNHSKGNWIWTGMDPQEMEHHWVWIDLQKLCEFWRRNIKQVMTCKRGRDGSLQQRISRDVNREARRGPSLGPILPLKHQIPNIPCHTLPQHAVLPCDMKPTAENTRLDQIPRCIPHFFIQSTSTTKWQRNSCCSKAWQPFGLLGAHC